jgi:hypothetical protein
MSITDLQKAFDLIENHRDQADFDGQKPEELISLAESVLRIKFPPTYRTFLSKYGCGDIAGQEFYGIVNADFINSSVPDAIWLTLDERKSSNLPEDFVIIYASSDGVYYSLDCSHRNDAGECPIIAWVPGVSKKEENLEYIAEDYGQFLFKTINQALS